MNHANKKGRCSLGRFGAIPLLVLMVVASIGCQSTSQPSTLSRFEFTSPHMGTVFKITLYAPDADSARSAAEAAFRRVAALEEIMSDYQADSELMRLCAQPAGQPVQVSEELFDILNRAQDFSRLSDGAFDVTVGPYTRLWRFSRKKKELPSETELAAARAAVGYGKLRLKRPNKVTLLVPNMRLDLGGIAKGYAADEALEVLRSKGLGRALVAASGDIAIGSPPPGQRGWRIGIAEMDAQSTNLVRNISLSNAGVSTSGDTEQAIEIGGRRYSHVIDPATGLGLTEHAQVTIIGRNATTTDALATSVNVMGVKRGLRLIESLHNVGAMLVTATNSDKQTIVSRRFDRIAPPVID